MEHRSSQLQIGAPVQDALDAGRPVVALESTIISHGMPYPQNLETALEVEEVVRDAGATPATIAILDGHYTVGLDSGQIERLATAKDVLKASRRDLAIAFARRLTAATTVATTTIGAAWAGIRIFATGGTGGVHRGVERTMDVSADLPELARTPVAVVSAGVKSILDIPRTIEYLETLGVPVLGFGTSEFPAFYTRTTGLEVTQRCDSAREVAEILAAQWNNNEPRLGGVLVANPIPAAAELEHGYIEGVIEQAVSELTTRGISGKEVTPFLLGRIVELTGGKSLEANVALVKNNARVAAEIAVQLAIVLTGSE